MKKATGFVTEDGTFYENEWQARLHDAREAVESSLSGDDDSSLFLAIVDDRLDLIKEYVDAKEAANKEFPAVESNSFDDGGGEEDATGVQSQPLDGPRNVSDVGSSAHAEEVSDGQAEHGTGSGQGDARRFRQRKVVAVNERAKGGKAR